MILDISYKQAYEINLRELGYYDAVIVQYLTWIALEK